MGKIIALQSSKDGKRIVISLEEGVSFILDKEIVMKADLCTGGEIDQDRRGELIREDNFQMCYDAALHYLSYRQRSESELRKHLVSKRNFQEAVVNNVIRKLEELKLIDDEAFAESWRNDRIEFNPRSRFLIRRELIQKGVNVKTIDELTREIDDDKSAYSVGLKKAKLLGSLSFEDFYRKLSGFLARRGYSRDVINATVRRLWESKNSGYSEF